MKHIGEKIKELRRKNDMTQEELAENLGVTYQTVSKWETGVTSPDLSLIIPIARLFKVTIDELFGFCESAEELMREELKKRYEDTFKTGDIDVRLAVCEEAVKAYPGDMEWLNNLAWVKWCNAVSIPDDAEFESEREKVIKLSRRIIENCDDNDIKGSAVVRIVGCLNGKGSHDEAMRYAELYPDVNISADEKERLLISCMTGEEQTAKKQRRIWEKAEELIACMIHGNTAPEEVLLSAEKIIDALIPDGNYLDFHHDLYMIALSRARKEIQTGNIDAATAFLKKAREHAVSYDAIQGEYAFTSPVFDHIKINTDDRCITGTTTALEDFRALFDFPQYLPIKSHRDFAELIK